jgi:hypothetical protein
VLLPSTKIYRKTTQAVVEIFDDGALILRLDDCHMFDLNETARDVLNLTDGKRNTGEVAAWLIEQYQIAAHEALQDVLELYESLAVQGLLEVVDTSSSERN